MKALALAAALVTAPVVALLALVIGVLVVFTPTQSAVGAPTCLPQPALVASEVDLDQEQLAVAVTIIDVARQLDVPPRGWVVALAAGMQESGLRPLPYGDRDSLGVFQQRTAWGTVAERMDPRSAAVMFFTGGHAGQRGLLDIPGWQSLSVTAAAQAVQVSAYPDAYAKWEPLAVQIVDQLADIDATCDQPAGWVFPLGDASHVATAGFGDCGAHWVACHTGQDYAAPTGTPVVATAAGRVTFAGWAGAYGNAVHILHAGGVATWYAHLSRIETTRDATVRAGQLIGLVGSTGNSTGPHLHFEVRTGASPTSDGDPIDPLRWLHDHRTQ